MICLVSSKSNGCFSFSLKILTFTLVPGSPLISFTASLSDLSFSETSWTSMTRSPDFRPAFCAGVSSIGAIIFTKPSSIVISIPMPPNLPVVPILSSEKSSFDR